jgi:dihydrofolate reductase
MRKLIVEEWMSLDGYVADKNGGLDFFTHLTAEQNTFSDAHQVKFMETVDTIVLGRKTYELFVDFWPNATIDQEIMADKINETKKIVFTHTLAKAPWGKWADAQIISGEAIEAIKGLKQLPGKNLVLWGSISLVQRLMQVNLIDEYHIQLCPVLTAGGRNLFTQQINPSHLNLIEVRHYPTGAVFLNYQPSTSK